MNYRGTKEVAEEGNFDRQTARDLEEEATVDGWLAEINKWIRKVDRDMGEGRAADGADPVGGAGSLTDSAPRPAG
jgi:hypothetical protein